MRRTNRNMAFSRLRKVPFSFLGLRVILKKRSDFMGLFKKFKESILSAKRAKAAMNEYMQNVKKYQAMPAAELTELSDEELYEAVIARADAAMRINGLNALTEAQLTILTADQLFIEVNNGGLCQFFVNSSRAFAPYVVESMEKLGKPEIAALYRAFIEENKIDVHDLSEFDIEKADDFADKEDHYPFDDFDNEFYTFSDIRDEAAPYLREHIGEL